MSLKAPWPLHFLIHLSYRFFFLLHPLPKSLRNLKLKKINVIGSFFNLKIKKILVSILKM